MSVNELTQSLCGQCEQIFRGPWERSPYAPDTWNRRGTLHSTFESLSLSAGKCQICHELLSTLVKISHNASSYSGSRLVTYELSDRAKDIVHLDFEHYAGSRAEILGRYRLYNFTEISDTPKISEAGITSSPEAWDIGRRWIDRCISSHQRCGQNDSWHPTRLLDIGNGSVRLIEPPPGFIHLYMTLSHCWGKVPMNLKLLKSNKESLLQNVPWNSLPNLFQEAITVTRRLALRYLWIDSLCIIQDSTEDWVREAAQMCSVYQHSQCNIAATRAINSQDTMFTPRALDVHPTVTTSWIGHKNYKYLILDDDFWEVNIDHAPLNERGWVVQERLLAPRVLHFGERQLLWECRETVGCQTLDVLPRLLRRDLRGTDTKDFAVDIFSWTKVVRYYSKCQLTQSNDKLVAIAGLAQSFERLGPTYVAGIWISRLPELLAWSVADASQASGAPSVRLPRAPAFSWASIEGMINHKAVEDGLTTGVSPLVTYVDHQVKYVHDSQYLQVKEASIKMHGHLLPVHITYDGRFSRVLCDQVHIEGWIDPDEPQQEGSTAVVLVPLIRTGAEITYCLMLVRDDASYRRWGLFSIYGDTTELRELWSTASYEEVITLI